MGIGGGGVNRPYLRDCCFRREACRIQSLVLGAPLLIDLLYMIFRSDLPVKEKPSETD